MNIAVTGATGFLGRHIANALLSQGHTLQCAKRSGSDLGGFIDDHRITWVDSTLADSDSFIPLINNVDAVIHAGLDWQGAKTGDIVSFCQNNLIGTLKLMALSFESGVERFIYISSCGVHDVILADRKLDEAHPLWPNNPYGALKASIEAFIASYGFGRNWQICALRPTGIYGPRRPIERQKWYRLIKKVMQNKTISTSSGGKEVHVTDCARAVNILLNANNTAGQMYNCYDHYIADQDIAVIAKEILGSSSEIIIRNQGCKNQIDTTKIEALGMTFGGKPLLRQAIADLIQQIETTTL